MSKEFTKDYKQLYKLYWWKYKILEGALISIRDKYHHRSCEDTWYSCPKLEECSNANHDYMPIEKRPCDCGYEERVEFINHILKYGLSETPEDASKRFEIE